MGMPMKHGGHPWLPTIFNDFFNNDVLMRNNTAVPAVNVIETDKEYMVEIAAAGMCKHDFKIEINGYNDLTITMEKGCNCKDGECCDTDIKECKENTCKEDDKCKDDKCDCNKRYLRREFSYTRFQQTLVLPDNADTAKIEAKVKHGVLHINIPKKSVAPENKETRTIAIE
jgi:HSP20 family protein